MQKIDLNTKIVLGFFLFSLCLVGLHKIGVLNTYYNVLDPRNKHSYEENNDNLAVSTVSLNQNNSVEMNCTVEVVTGNNFCGISIFLGRNLEQGIDLSSYKNILVDIGYKAPNSSTEIVPSIKMYFRNYNKAYSNPNDLTSSKYNSIQFEPTEKSSNQAIPFSALQVATWWIEQYSINYQNSLVDLTNVTLVEFGTNHIKTPGEYQIQIKRLTLQGEWISEPTLLNLLLLMWLFVAIYLVNRQHNILQRVSNTDPLTNVMNRRGLNTWFNQHLHNQKKHKKVIMFYIDLDDFKKINDSYGHLVGDEVLIKFCVIIKEEIDQYFFSYKKNTNILARLSGDEFAFVFVDLSDNQILDIANNLLKRLSKEIKINNMLIKVNASIGISKTDHLKNYTATDLMEHADAAMYHSKKSGKNRYKIYDKDVSTDFMQRKSISHALSEAIQLNQFNLVFMPIYHCDSLNIVGVEVLIRCSSDKLKNIGPDIFIPIAEEYGLIKIIDLWVLENTCKVISQNKSFIERNNLMFCINISALELNNTHFPEQLNSLLTQYEISPKNIELELTETSLINVDEQSITLLNQLKDIGVSLSLDDFGTGYTAFNQLINYPVNCIKIDRSFINKLTEKGSNDSTMVDIILGIAKSYNLCVVAEGVETKFQYDYLKEKQCDLLQGYYFSKPITWPQLLTILS